MRYDSDYPHVGAHQFDSWINQDIQHSTAIHTAIANEIGFGSGFPEMATNNTTNSQSDNTKGFSRLPPSTDFGPQINYTLWFLTALSLIFLALRVYCKFLRHRGLWWDDHLLIGSWVSPPWHAPFFFCNCVHIIMGC